MWPRLGPLPVPTPYGLMVALGLIAALTLTGKLARRRGMDPKAVQDVLAWSCLAGLLGAKLLLVFEQPSDFFREPLALLLQGGVFYGGVLAAAVVTPVLAHRKGLPLHALADVCAPALALGHAFGRIGCFLAGCCWGRACDLPWAVVYHSEHAVAHHSLGGLAVHPVQVYEAGGELLLMLGALWLFSRQRFAGQTWWTYVVAYGALRTWLETYRGDPRGRWFGDLLSTSQVVGIGAMVIGLIFLVYCARKRHPPTPLDDDTSSGADGPDGAAELDEAGVPVS
ncbi:MAG: prolipoprotein diacylglyceryl transferase [Acidobacteriota bacterium]